MRHFSLIISTISNFLEGNLWPFWNNRRTLREISFTKAINDAQKAAEEAQKAAEEAQKISVEAQKLADEAITNLKFDFNLSTALDYLSFQL